MNENKLFLSGVCPYCPAVLEYAEDSRAVTCHSCGNVVPTRMLRPLDFVKRENVENEDDKRIADGVTSSSAGIIYFDNFCESYNWKDFALQTNLSIPTLESIREACKIKFSADPITYLLDFRCIAIPVLKKIEGLDVLEVEIIDNYKSDDLSDLFEYVDLYSAITQSIVEKRSSLIKALAADIKLAKKFGANPIIVHDLEQTYYLFVEKIAAVKVISNIEDIPGYQKAKAIRDAKLAIKIRKKGIDAEKTYEKALSLMEAGNVDNALHLFSAVYGYKDSEKYIDDSSKIFKFNNELVEMASNYYLIKKDSEPIFDPKQPDPTYEGVMSLYQINRAIPSKSPALTMISDVIHSYGSKIFYMRNNVSICCYFTESTNYNANVKILDEGPSGDYVLRHSNPIYYSSDKSKFFIRKKLREVTSTKRGCFGRKKVTKKLAENRGNNYSIVLVDMDNVTSKIILPEVVDIMDYYNDKIFYTVLEKDSKYPSFRVYDIEKETSTEILNSNCLIHSVSNGKIIYSQKVGNTFNSDIYSIDIDTRQTYLVDSNIRKYYTTHGNRVFYTVGTDEDIRLYSAAFDGTRRCEVMLNPGRICTFSSGWLYYINGTGVNTCLMKVSLDGTKNVLVASRFEKLVKMLNGYVYYIATNGDLKVVRCDGCNDTRIAPNIDDLSRIIIDKENVYYLKKDYVGVSENGEGTLGYSLYSTDLKGKDLHKIAHDISSMVEYSDRYIYLCKKRNSKYSVVTPINKKNSSTEIIDATLTYYESYDKVTKEFHDIVRLGTPAAKMVTYRKSRLPFSKYVNDYSTVTELEGNFVRRDVAPIGLIEKEEIEAEMRERARIAEENAAKEQAKQQKKDEKRQAKEAEKQANRQKKAAKAAKKKSKEDAKRQQSIAKQTANRDAAIAKHNSDLEKEKAAIAKSEARKAEKENKRQEKDQLKKEEHEKLQGEINDFLDEREKIAADEKTKLDEKQTEKEAKANERKEAKERRDEDVKNKYDAEQERYNAEMARYEQEMIKREEKKQAKREAKQAKKSK